MASGKLGLPGIVLMENAAINAAAAVLDLIDNDLGLEPWQARVAVVCGGGNNGGDGFAVARHLSNWGGDVSVWALKPIDQIEGDAAVNARVVRAMGLRVVEARSPEVMDATAEGVSAGEVDTAWDGCAVVIDAVLGTGFGGGGSIREPAASAIRAINGVRERRGGLASPIIVSLDVPSGLDCDTGEAADVTVRADVTVTFAGMKLGFIPRPAERWVGRVLVADIGVPPELIEEAIGGGERHA